jgi:hypothetical protein
MFTISDISRPVSVIFVTYPGVVVPHKYRTTASGVLLHPIFILANCHAPMSLSAVKGVLGGVMCRAGSLRGDLLPIFVLYNECSTRAGRHGDSVYVSPGIPESTVSAILRFPKYVSCLRFPKLSLRLCWDRRSSSHYCESVLVLIVLSFVCCSGGSPAALSEPSLEVLYVRLE